MSAPVAKALVFGATAGSCVPGPVPEAPPVEQRALPAAILVEELEPKIRAVHTRREPFKETLHGRDVVDPYRWLEDDQSSEVGRWVDEQNALTERALGQVSERDAIRKRLDELATIGDVAAPAVTRRRGGFRYFYTRRHGRQDQPMLLARDTANGTDRIVVDPNRLSAKGDVALDWYYPSPDGRLVAYGTSEHGSESSTLRLVEVETGRILDDVIPNTRHSSIAWRGDASGFFYARYPAPGEVPAGEESLHRKIYEHRLGSDPQRDPLVFGEALAPTDFPNCATSPRGRWLVITVHQGWTRSDVYLGDLHAPRLELTRLTEGREHLYAPVLHDDVLYVLTNEGAPRYQLLAVDPKRPARAGQSARRAATANEPGQSARRAATANEPGQSARRAATANEPGWRSVIAEHPADVLDSLTLVGGELLASYLSGGATRLERFDRRGQSLGRVELPTVGTSGGFSGHVEGSEAFFDFESIVQPRTIHRLDLSSARTTIWAEAAPGFAAPSDWAVHADETTSRDGTRIPYLTAVPSKGRDGGPRPTVLYGYGGFNVSVLPRFSRAAYLLLERGATYVQAVLRGGGELGEHWHQAGRLDKKQNTFDDFVAVAESLVDRGLTAPDRLGIWGRSNGGLLVCAVLAQRPELFRAAVASVPLTDMLRFHRFLLGKLWTTEYGSPDEPDAFRWLAAYSPYHNVRDGVPYPAVLLTTASHDSRVHPMHARKMAASLQHASSSGHPVLLRSETEAGHGAGKPMSKVVDESTDVLTFFLWQLAP